MDFYSQGLFGYSDFWIVLRVLETSMCCGAKRKSSEPPSCLPTKKRWDVKLVAQQNSPLPVSNSADSASCLHHSCDYCP